VWRGGEELVAHESVAGSRKVQRRRKRKQSGVASNVGQPLLAPVATSPRTGMSLASALRSPRMLREALIVDAALGPRRPRR